MSDIALNSAQRQPTVTDTTGTAARTTTQPNTSTTPDTPTDQVSLSPAAQVTSAAFSGATLNDKDAVSTSVGLRQSIGTASLSVSAKQNQAILSLLR
ncbi:hypothetical protein GCM10011611_53890 [Aliidongia dinghuensis]|uniref:Flagellin n=1 Tax=Aliidongia dinghuensis TaxID=1867774 RepID=A0A8J2YZH1_9PROT|nr:hypothetical protein [Aliidongia dinghuensis]GGF40681.1 hypothetical protein GCM10011611_53890 [Aliidongia dinghuensis]